MRGYHMGTTRARFGAYWRRRCAAPPYRPRASRSTPWAVPRGHPYRASRSPGSCPSVTTSTTSCSQVTRFDAGSGDAAAPHIASPRHVRGDVALAYGRLDPVERVPVRARHRLPVDVLGQSAHVRGHEPAQDGFVHLPDLLCGAGERLVEGAGAVKFKDWVRSQLGLRLRRRARILEEERGAGSRKSARSVRSHAGACSRRSAWLTIIRPGSRPAFQCRLPGRPPVAPATFLLLR